MDLPASLVRRLEMERGPFAPHWSREIVVGGVCWILSAQFLVAQAIAQAAWKTPYSLLDNAISDLGNTACGQWPPPGIGSQLAQKLGVGGTYVCSPLHNLMNASFVVVGLLLLVGLYLTRKAWPRRRLTSWSFVVLGLAGVGKIVVGLAPENTRLLIHSLGALGIPCASIGILLLGVAVWQTHRRTAILSIALGAIGLLGLLGGVAFTGLGHGHGAGERIAEYPAIVWMVVLGVSFVWARPPAATSTVAAALTPEGSNRLNAEWPTRGRRARSRADLDVYRT
jgi:hypothetical membrane protein